MKKNTTRISAGNAIDLSNQTLEWVKTQRELKMELWIQNHMKKDQRGFWETLFNKPPRFPTRQEAEKALHTSSYGEYYHPSPYEDIQYYWSDAEALAKRIKKLASFSMTGYITITDESLDRLVQ